MKRNTKKIILGVVLAAVVGAVVFVTPKIISFGYVTTRATARVACPMIFLQGRDKAFALDHMNDLAMLPFDPHGRVNIDQNDAERSIRVTVYGLFEAHSIYYPGEGCVLQ